MVRHFAAIVGLFCVCLCQVSCSRRATFPKVDDGVPVTKVTGRILIDDVAVPGVMVRYKPETEIGEKRPQFSRHYVITKNDGTFALKTYRDGDGVPAGEYSLYCQLFALDPQDARENGDEDRLGGQYSPPNPPVKQFTVENGKPVDLGTIELKTPGK